MTIGGKTTVLWQTVVRLSLLLPLALSISACYSRPFFDKPVPPAAPAPEQALPAETGRPAPGQPVDESPAERQRIAGGVYPGTDTFIRRGAPPAAAVVRMPAGEVTLNFVDADLREVVKAILGDTLGANYVMDPQVQGTVTLQTSQPVAGSSLVSVLESLLAVNNATLVQSDGIYKIVPADQGVRGSGGIRSSLPHATQAPGAQVMAVPLRYVSATEMEKVLAPFAPPGGVLRVDPRRNLLVIGGSRSDVASMLDVIETFDVDWLAGMSFGLFPVKSTTAKTMVEELEKVFGDQAEGPLANVVRFVPIERLNAVLVISSRSQYIDRARTWVSRLDIGEGEKVRLYVYYCENSRAEDLAQVLGSIFGQPEQARPAAQVAPGLRGRTVGGRMGGLGGGAGSAFGGRGGFSGGFGGQGMGGGLLGGGLGGQTLGGGGLGGGLGGGGLGGQTLGGQSPLTGQGMMGAAPGAGGEAAQVAASTESLRIVADRVKNALVIQAKPSDYRTIEAAIKKLDITPLQVLIEATILEVRLNDALQYGVEWYFKFGGGNQAVWSNFSPSPNRIQPSFLNDSGAVASTFPGFSYILSPQNNVKAVVNALDTVSDVNVISSPQIFVLDNQSAQIMVGDSVPITTQSGQSIISANAPIVNSIEYRDTGVILEVIPRVNAGGLVTMEISQEVSNVSPATQNTSAQQQTPTINQRVVTSTASVQSGETVALGGLITDDRRNTSSGLPFLSRLPIIGWLFGTKSDTAARTELLVLITPRVVGSADQARQVTQELRSRLRTVAPLEERIR
jgi:general secretion pathway protein D